MKLEHGFTTEKPISPDPTNALQIATYNFFVKHAVICENTGATIYAEFFDNPTSTLTTSLAGSNVPTYSIEIGPGQTGDLEHQQFKTGLYIRIATARSTGGVLGPIAAAAAAKITVDGLHWPMSNA